MLEFLHMEYCGNHGSGVEVIIQLFSNFCFGIILSQCLSATDCAAPLKSERTRMLKRS